MKTMIQTLVAILMISSVGFADVGTVGNDGKVKCPSVDQLLSLFPYGMSTQQQIDEAMLCQLNVLDQNSKTFCSERIVLMSKIVDAVQAQFDNGIASIVELQKDQKDLADLKASCQK